MKPLWKHEDSRGCTERLLRTAVETGMQDKAVFVVAEERHIGRMLQRALAMTAGLRLVNSRSIWCPGGGYVRFMSAHEGMLRALMKHGCATFTAGHDRTVIMIDHRVVEQEMGFGLDQWLRWCRED